MNRERPSDFGKALRIKCWAHKGANVHEPDEMGCQSRAGAKRILGAFREA